MRLDGTHGDWRPDPGHRRRRARPHRGGRRPGRAQWTQARTAARARPAADVIEAPPEGLPEVEAPSTAAPTVEKPEATATRLQRLRQRLAGSQGALGRGLLALLSRDKLDEDTWESIEDALLTADVGVGPTQELVGRLRTRLRVEGGEAPDPRTRAPRGAGHPRRPDDGPAAPGHRRGRQPGRRARGRRQRRRQDHHGRQDRPDPGRRGPHGPARRGRHVPGRRGRPAGDLGRARRRRGDPWAGGHRPGQRRLRGGQGRASSAASTRSSSTPPAGSRTRPA